MQRRAKLHTALGKQEDEVSSSTVAQRLTVLEEKMGEIVAHLQAKKQLKKVGAKEVVYFSNDKCFLGLDVDVAFSGSPVRRHTG